MKKGIKKKVAKAIVKEMKKITESDKCVPARESVYRTPYDQMTSQTMITFIKKIIEQDGTTMDVRADRIYINCRDVKQLKTGKVSGYSDDRYLEIEIDEEGFSFTYGHSGRNYFEDKEIYTQTMKDFESVIIQKSKTNLNKAIDNIYFESGLIRENNLDKLLD
jgi:hypothetical protein